MPRVPAQLNGKINILEETQYSAKKHFERFRVVLELISRFEFDFRRCGNGSFFGVFGGQSDAM